MPEDSGPTEPVVVEKPKGPRKLTSLSELVEAAKKSPPKPDPILLEWFYPGEEEPTQLEVEVRYPDDAWLFGVKYMTEIQDLKRSQEADEKGITVNKHPDADFHALAKECIVNPSWLRIEGNIKKFKETVPSPVFAELRRKLMLVAGLNGDFFGDYHQLTVPRIFQPSASGSVNGSDSPPGPSTTAEPKISSPGSTTTASAEPKIVVSA